MNNKCFLFHITDTNAIEHPLRNRIFLIGSNNDNNIVLTGAGTAPVMCTIEPDNRSVYRCTAVSKITVSVNGRKIKSCSLSHGDTVRIGKNRFIFIEQTAPVHPGSVPANPYLSDNLKRFIKAVGRERQLRPLLQNLLNTLIEITGGSDLFLFKLDANGNPLIFESNGTGKSEERFSDTVVQSVLETKKGICISNALNNPIYRKSQSISDLKLRSVICTPILTAGKCIGLIYIGSQDPAVSFTHEDLESVAIYASIAGMLIHHIDFISEQRDTIKKLAGTVDQNHGIIASSQAMHQVISAVSAIASSNISVLLEGETGTGKSRIAELIHHESRRSDNRFVVVNCSALHGELLESELFGHKKGSFTGATRDHEGLFASAAGGTLFLDEIGELEPSLQAKLLRTLESNTVRPIGAVQEKPVDVRILCATNRNLSEMVDKRTFRADLYYRINQFTITIPPLRERGEDIVLLAYLFLNHFKTHYTEKDIVDFHPDALHFIRTYSWPGNIRELSNCIHRGILMSPAALVRLSPTATRSEIPFFFDEATRQFQKSFLEKAISVADGSKELAARNIGLSRSTFYRYLSQLDVN